MLCKAIDELKYPNAVKSSHSNSVLTKSHSHRSGCDYAAPDSPFSVMRRRRHDSALGNGVSSDDDDAAPGGPKHMHELQSDGEEGEGEVNVLDDDIDPALSALMNKAPSSAASSAAAAAYSSSSDAPLSFAASVASSIHALPSYAELMASVRAESTSCRKAMFSASSAASSPSPGSAAAEAYAARQAAQAAAVAAGSSSSASTVPAAPYTHDADENLGYLRDDRPGHQDGDAEDSDDSDDGESPIEHGRQYTFEEMMARARRLESKGFLRKASHFYLYCLEHYRYSSANQQLLAEALRRLGDICYRNKKYKEALQFRTAERMLYESNLLRVVKTDAKGGIPLPANVTAALAQQQAHGVAVPASASSSSANPLSTRQAGSSTASRILSSPSVDPSPLPKSALTPALALADENRALTFERLARVFFEEGNIEMAKSYALKSIAIRKKIKEKWGDPAKMSPEQLQLHQLAVMGREQYENTLRRFKTPEDGVSAAAEDDDPVLSATDPASRAKALQLSMQRSLAALSAGKFDNGANADSSSSESDGSSLDTSDEERDGGDDSKQESEETVRIRRANRAAKRAAKKAAEKEAAAASASARGKDGKPQTRRKKVAFNPGGASPNPAAASSSAAASSVIAAAEPSLASVVKESSPLPKSKRRALCTSLLVALLVAVLAVGSSLVLFRDNFFPTRLASNPPGLGERYNHQSIRNAATSGRTGGKGAALQ
jgi:hypothetical protein